MSCYSIVWTQSLRVCCNTPERVAEGSFNLWKGMSTALDVEEGRATVTSSRSKGKYGEELQPQTQDKRRHLRQMMMCK